MPDITLRSARGPVLAVLLGSAALMTTLLGAVLAGGPVAAANNASTSTTVTPPPGVAADLRAAQADLAKMKSVLAEEEKQQQATTAAFATIEKDVKDAQPGSGAADEVSEAMARLFATHATAYQSLAAQASALHDQFVQALQGAGGAYAAAEAAKVRPTP